MIVVLVGESASGKTTLAKKLEAESGVKRVVTYTTRPMRNGEHNGIDYNFIDKREFDELVADDSFAEHANYRGWDYGTIIDVDNNNDSVVVLTPSGARSVRKYLSHWGYDKYNVIVVYLSVDRYAFIDNAFNRARNTPPAALPAALYLYSS